MPTAVPERIITTIKSRLELITVLNGYGLNVASVDRVNRLAADWTPKNLSLVLTMGDEERNPPHDRPGNPPAMAYNLPVLVYGFVRLGDRAVAREQTTVNALLAAVKKAIANTSTWYQFDNATYNADFGTMTPIVTTDHFGFTLPLVVQYRISELDPFTVRA